MSVAVRSGRGDQAGLRDSREEESERWTPRWVREVDGRVGGPGRGAWSLLLRSRGRRTATWLSTKGQREWDVGESTQREWQASLRREAENTA